MADEEKIKKLIDDHWEYVKMLCEMNYKTAFLHGYKHGLNEATRHKTDKHCN